MRQASPLAIVLLLWLAGLGAAAQFGKASVTFDLLKADWPGASAIGLGLFVSIVGLPGLFLGTTAGILVQGAGYRRVLVAALGAGALLSALQALLPPLPVMLTLRAAEGCAHLAIVVAAPVLIAQITPVARQGLAMSLWSSFFGVTYMLLALVGRPLVESFGVPALFLVHSAYMACLAILLWAALPDDPPQAARQVSPRGLLAQHLAIYASPRIAAPAMGFFCYTITYVAVLTLLPQFVGAPLRDTLAALMPLVSIVASLILGVWLLARMAAVRVVMLGFGIAAASAMALAAGWGQQGPTLWACLALAGALGLVQGASFAAIPQLNARPEDRAQAAGAIAQLGNLGTTTGTPLLAAVLAGYGMTGLAVFLVSFSALGGMVHLWQIRRRQSLSI